MFEYKVENVYKGGNWHYLVIDMFICNIHITIICLYVQNTDNPALKNVNE